MQPYLAPDGGSVETLNPGFLNLAKMALIYGGLHLLYGLLPDQWLSTVAYRFAFTQPGASLIRMFAPGETVAVMDHELRSPQLVLEVVRGCDGSGALFLFIAALLAAGGKARGLLLGLTLGGLGIYGFNLLRLVALYFIGTRAPQWFDVAHEYVFPGLLVVSVVAFVLIWTGRQIRASADAGRGGASSALLDDEPKPQQQQHGRHGP